VDKEEAISILKKYENELGNILGRFKRTSDSIHIDQDDDPRFRQLVIELRDFLDDSLGTNNYSTMIVNHFNEGIANFLGTQSYKSVESIRGVVSAVITRIKCNPKILMGAQGTIQTRPEAWSVIRSILHERVSFGSIKVIAGLGGIDLTRMAHLEQTTGSGGATKSQLLSAIDQQISEMDETRRLQFIRIVIEETLRRQPAVESDLRDALERFGWTLHDGHLIEFAILDVSELPELPPVSHADLVKASMRLRDGDLSGAVSAACAAVDSVTSRIYVEKGLGDPSEASFQEKVSRSLAAKGIWDNIEKQLVELGWAQPDAKVFTKNLQRALNQGAYVMGALRSRMGDVHGTKPILKPLVFDSIKWATLIVRHLS
jgi:hypothetical protein